MESIESDRVISGSVAGTAAVVAVALVVALGRVTDDTIGDGPTGLLAPLHSMFIRFLTTAFLKSVSTLQHGENMMKLEGVKF